LSPRKRFRARRIVKKTGDPLRHTFSTRRLTRAALIAALLSGAATAALAQAPVSTAPRSNAATASTEDKLQALEAEVEALKAQLADLKASTVAEIKDVRDSTPPKPTGSISIVKGSPTFSSADGSYTASLHGVLQFDTAAYDQQSPGPTTTDLRRSGPALGASATNVDLTHARELKDGDLFRRARIGVDGTAPGSWEYRLLFDFGGTGVENAGQLYEGWAQYSGIKPLHIRVGAFAPSLGLADANSTSYMPFLDRPSPVDISRNLAGGDSRTAAQVFGYGNNWFASAAVTGRTVGAINTNNVIPITSTTTSVTVGTAQTYGDQLAFTGRAAFDPIATDDLRVHLGAHGSYVDRPANVSGPAANGGTPISSFVIALNGTPELRVDGTKLINTGNIDARNASEAGAEFAVRKGPFFLASEYEHLAVQRSDINSTPQFGGYYVEGTWFLTGESKTYNTSNAAFDGPGAINHVFNPRAGGLGAIEFALRWSDMNLNYHPGDAGKAPAADAVRGGEQKIFSAGLNWYPTPIVRFMLDYQHVNIDRLSPNATVYQTPAGAQIGQTYNAVALRSQVAF
jgi:phosphate-selective porin OprO/OprP